MTVFGVGVVASMVAWGLNQAQALKQRDEWTVFRPCAVSPFVDLVCIGSKDYDQPNLPGERSEQERNRQHQRADEQQEP